MMRFPYLTSHLGVKVHTNAKSLGSITYLNANVGTEILSGSSLDIEGN